MLPSGNGPSRTTRRCHVAQQPKVRRTLQREIADYTADAEARARTAEQAAAAAAPAPAPTGQTPT